MVMNRSHVHRGHTVALELYALAPLKAACLRGEGAAIEARRAEEPTLTEAILYVCRGLLGYGEGDGGAKGQEELQVQSRDDISRLRARHARTSLCR